MTGRLAWLALAAFLVLVGGVAGWIVRDSRGPNPDLAMLLRDAAPVALGALIGAIGALIVALINRAEARRSRLYSNALALAKEVVIQADIHVREVQALVSWLEDWVGGNSEGDAPKVHSTEAVRQAYLALGIVDKELGAKGEDVYTAMVAIDEQTDPFTTDPMRVYERWDRHEYQDLITAYTNAVEAFHDAWRARPG